MEADGFACSGFALASVRAQNDVFFNIKGIVHGARRMIGANVQGCKVVFVILNFWTDCNGKTCFGKKIK